MVVIDATIILLLLRPGILVPLGSDGVAIEHPKERIEHLVSELERAKTKIIIPTPALSEVLVRAGAVASQQIVDRLSKHAAFSIEPFDTRAAIEVAAMTREELDSGNGKRGGSAAVWAKVKYDRQIVAIAKVNSASTIYSDDGDIKRIASRSKITVKGLADLPLPDSAAQYTLALQERQEEPQT